MDEDDAAALGCVTLVGLPLLLAALITHVVQCYETQHWAFLILGSALFPIGVIHGVWIWFEGLTGAL